MSRKFSLKAAKPMTPYELKMAVWSGEGAAIAKSLAWMREHGGSPQLIADAEKALGLAPGQKLPAVLP